MIPLSTALTILVGLWWWGYKERRMVARLEAAAAAAAAAAASNALPDPPRIGDDCDPNDPNTSARVRLRELVGSNLAYRRSCLSMAYGNLLNDRTALARVFLWDYIEGSSTKQALAQELGMAPDELMHLISPEGKPTYMQVFVIFRTIKEMEGLEWRVTTA
ncbi:MAG: hypothetical protein JST98_10270, partial [Bacteroidetes bacterium]|nr:hypothetical protein [Bacteroidota bacterium]